MRVAVAARDLSAKRSAVQRLAAAGLIPVEAADHPAVLICYGGDGTFLAAERLYPGVPKLLIRNSKIGKLCEDATLEEAFAALREGRFHTEAHPKLIATIRDREYTGVNDIVVRNVLPTYALRFHLAVGTKHRFDQLIGDGIVVAAPRGSSGYFYSIARRTFSSGFGIAFNNMTEPRDPLMFGEDEAIELTLTRGEAVVASDNDPSCAFVRPGDTIRIGRSNELAHVLRLRRSTVGLVFDPLERDTDVRERAERRLEKPRHRRDPARFRFRAIPR